MYMAPSGTPPMDAEFELPRWLSRRMRSKKVRNRYNSSVGRPTKNQQFSWPLLFPDGRNEGYAYRESCAKTSSAAFGAASGCQASVSDYSLGSQWRAGRPIL